MNLDVEITAIAESLNGAASECELLVESDAVELSTGKVMLDVVADTLAIKRIIEGLIMAANEPLSLEYLHKLLTTNHVDIEKKNLREIIEVLRQEYVERHSAIELKEVASGYRFQVNNDLACWISKLWEEKPPRYSRAYLETLSIIIYKQPVTRAEIEEIRGVSVSSNIIKTLLDHGWIKIVGYKEVPGRPALYVTTAKFLDYFNLKNLEDLPKLAAPELISNLNLELGSNEKKSDKNSVTADFLPEQEL